MKKLILIAILAVIGWQGYAKYQSRHIATANIQVADNSSEAKLPQQTRTENGSSSAFKCDGRTHCSQMTSCEEATFFLRNCPDVKMDGNNDGIPCEKQWCK